ncbi:MAG: trigger factor [Oscillospiraceae bacterium]|nr:trigger factor [Oscillospiraceae bacterium]
MKLKSSEKKDNKNVELVIEVEAAELETAVNKAYNKNKNRIAVPGFRKGKAPRKIIERMYGKEIFLSDALDDILPDVLTYAAKETDFETVGYPSVSDVDLNDDNSTAVFTLLAALYPEVEIENYKGLTAPKPSVEVTDSEIDNEIASVRTRNARIEKADRPAKIGDIAVIDFEGFVDGVAFPGGKGENYELELGSGQFIPGFEDKVEGMAAGEERDLDLVFPEQYKEDLAGKPVIFKVKLVEVKEKSLPDLDDEFAKDVSEFDTFDEYKADIKAKLIETRQKDVDETFESILMEKIAESIDVDVPEAMIDEQFDNSMSTLTRQISAYGMQPDQYMRMLGTTPEVFKERMRDNSLKQVKVALALGKIAELEAIEISKEEIEEEYKEASEKYKMEIEKLKETVEEKDITRDLKLRKAAKIVIDNATVEEFKEDKSSREEKLSKEKPAKEKKLSKEKPAKEKKPSKEKTGKKKPALEKDKTDEEEEG